ncbi:MAG TPA: tRNA lysidine(34) synthetase TilS, partial [Longimicrobiales bacterium]|nr:tRNA lysidine(34) synthetase TilS [Longimicrobiales bacterium]
GRELGRIVLRRRPTSAPDVALEIPGAGRGHGRARVGGRWLRVSWGGREAPAGRGGEPFSAARLRFPLRVRGREPGDRVRLAYGTKKLKKLFLERRVPPSARAGVALLVDADGTVLWIPGIARSVHAVPTEGEETMTIEIADADAD